MKLHPHSVYFKLFLAYGVAFFVLAMGALLMREISTTQPNYEISQAHLETYVRFLAQNIGDPPQMAKALKLVKETGLHIALWGPNLAWSSPSRFLAHAQAHPTGQVFAIPFGLYWWKDSGEATLTVVQGPYHYSFSEFHADHHLSPWLAGIAALTIILAVMASFILVRLILRPLKFMCQTALQWGAHDWKPRVAPAGKDELAILGRTLDQMADQIEKDFQASQELLTAVSHDLRSPLTRMRLTCELLPESPQRQSLIEEIRLLDRLTGSVLDQRRLVQPGALRRELVSLQPWFQAVMAPWMTRPLLKLEICLEGRNVTALIDTARWEQVFNNLLENTLKHKVREAAEVVVTLFTPPACDEGVFVIEVADQGPGVPAAHLSKLGEPFFQVDQSRNQTAEGFGLGLSLVKGILEAHGGSFTAKNLSPKGLLVQLRCPC